MTARPSIATAPLQGLLAFAESLRAFVRWQTFAAGVLVVSEPGSKGVSRGNGKAHS